MNLPHRGEKLLPWRTGAECHRGESAVCRKPPLKLKCIHPAIVTQDPTDHISHERGSTCEQQSLHPKGGRIWLKATDSLHVPRSCLGDSVLPYHSDSGAALRAGRPQSLQAGGMVKAQHACALCFWLSYKTLHYGALSLLKKVRLTPLK